MIVNLVWCFIWPDVSLSSTHSILPGYFFQNPNWIYLFCPSNLFKFNRYSKQMPHCWLSCMITAYNEHVRFVFIPFSTPARLYSTHYIYSSVPMKCSPVDPLFWGQPGTPPKAYAGPRLFPPPAGVPGWTFHRLDRPARPQSFQL